MRLRPIKKNVLAALAALLAAGPAHATPSAKLTYVRGPGAEACPDEAALRSAVSERLGYDPFFPWAKRSVIVEIDPSGGAFAGRLQLVGEDGALVGERKLGPRTLCPELVRTLALATAIALDDLEAAAPSASPPPVPPEPVPQQRPVDPSASPGEATSPPQPAPQEARVAGPGRRWAAAVSLTGSFGVEPNPAMGARAALGVRISWFSLAIEAEGSLPASSTTRLGGRVQDAVETGALVSCAHWGVASGCVVASAGRLLGESLDVSWPRSGNAWVVSTGARAGVEVGLGTRFFGFLDVTAMVLLTPVTVRLNDQSVYSTPTVSGAGAIGIGVRF